MNRPVHPRVVSGVGTGRGDAELLRDAFATHAPALLAYARSLTGGDWARAEDIVQETFARACRHPEALDPGRGSPRPWLFTVARHVAVDAHRARAARPTEVGDAPLALLPVPDDDIDRALDSWLVAEALQSLSEKHREVLLLTFYRQRSVSEAAATLGVPEGTVKSRAYYALRALKVALAERGVEG
ncbi:MAG TPA: sigma-70 family RNA polymerase sigma factor [Actinomycetales bacterium]|nr:sigma-70 family RNA polymerase sigma factor [Actinomycetales bacterium]